MTEVQRLVKIKLLKELLQEYELRAKYNTESRDYDLYSALDWAVEALEQTPKMGRWLHRNDDAFDWYECSECGYGAEGEITSESGARFRYCPNCGAKMSEIPTCSGKPNKWIPVSERLPEDGQNVLFCDIDEDIMIGYHVKGRPTTHFSQDGTCDDMKNVRAWCPLPEPYKESEGEE